MGYRMNLYCKVDAVFHSSLYSLAWIYNELNRKLISTIYSHGCLEDVTL